MYNSSIYIEYKSQLQNLKEIVNKVNLSSISEEPDEFFVDNINFFTKSFLINLCAYLESFLKDITFSFIESINDKIEERQIPYNLILWALNYHKEIKEKDFKYENLKIGIKKKDLDDHISGNPFRTVKLLRNIGLDIESFQEFQDKKESVNMIVNKRNKILHYNDSASDLSLTDIIAYIAQVDDYMKLLDMKLEEHKNNSCQFTGI